MRDRHSITYLQVGLLDQLSTATKVTNTFNFIRIINFCTKQPVEAMTWYAQKFPNWLQM